MADETADAGAQPSAPMEFDAAFAAAEAAAGGGAEGDEGGADSTGGDEGSTDATDDATAADTSEEGQTDEASSGTVEDDSVEAQAGSGEEAETPRLKALLEKVPEQHRADIRKYIDASIQPKFQSIAAQKKFIDAFRADPVKAAKQVLKEKGIDVDAPAEETATAAPSEIKAQLLKAGLTPEAAEAIDQILNPVIKGNEEAREAERIRDIAQNVDRDIESFKKDYPDYDELEPAMAKLMDEFLPAPGVSQRRYLETLRSLALGPKKVAADVKKVVKGMTANAKSATPKSRSVPASTVQPGSKKVMDFNESAEMALRGERVGRGITR